MNIKISILLLLTTIGITCGQGNGLIACGSNKTILSATCVCGTINNHTFVRLQLETFAVNDTATGKPKCIKHLDIYEACANISCFLTINISSSPVKKNDIIPKSYPHMLTIPPGGNKNGHRFNKRQTSACEVTSLKNASIQCWIWPEWKNCNINCMHGYALETETGTVTTKNINCRSTENIWKPHGFQDCEPYLNCKAQLIRPGKLKCKQPVDGPAYCDISCLEYEEDEATSLRKYKCLNDTFAQSLPHCAALKNGMSLVQKPKQLADIAN